MDEWESVDSVEESFVFPQKPSSPVTLVLVGRTGNGKSATGNSILGSKRFRSKQRAKSVTTTCEVQGQIVNGRSINVIDTPGLFDVSDPQLIGKELAKCVHLAKDGIQGIVVVLSVLHRLTPEEIAAVENLRLIFGPKVLNYMIVLFTGGDDLDESLDEYLDDSPTFLQEFVASCDGRKVIFDNKTKDKKTLEKQVADLLKVLDTMTTSNNGIPYTPELFQGASKINKSLVDEKQSVLEARFSKIEEDMKRKADGSKLVELEKELREQAEEQRKIFEKEAREQAEEQLKIFEKRLEKEAKEQAEEQRKIFEKRLEKEREEERKNLEKEFEARIEELHNKYKSNKSSCSIL